MLNYAETASSSTNVPLPIPCTLDQIQAPTVVPLLSALLEHPEFQRGLADAHEEFLGSYKAAPLTQDEMIEEVEMSLSRHVTERCKQISLVYGEKPSSYLFNLGFVVGVIDKGLTYAR
jgi:hypothetical protein